MGRKRKIQEDPDSPNGEKTEVVRNSANERERDRMRVLSKAFVKLKTTLPWVPPDTKLSKLDTLRLATCYIAHLRQILAEDDEDNESVDLSNGQADGGVLLPISGEKNDTENSQSSGFTHPINLTWPFSFQNKTPSNGSSSPPNGMCQQPQPSIQQHAQIAASS